MLVRAFGIGEGDEVITTPFSFIASSNCILYERAKPVFVDIEPDTANIDPNLVEDAIISRYVIRVGVDEPTPERQSAVRDHVMRRFQEAGIGCRPYFTPIHLQPFYRAEFGFKEGDFPVTELAGRTSIAIPFHNHLTAEEIDYVAGVPERTLGGRQ
ncbi:MAG: hypothetical protein GX492_05900 [Firmicutes bacterium]|nr:hypothetical protein [Bacillota bacterium]